MSRLLRLPARRSKYQLLNRRFALCLILALIALYFLQYAHLKQPKMELPDLYDATITELQDGLQKGLFTSVDLVKVFLYLLFSSALTVLEGLPKADA